MNSFLKHGLQTLLLYNFLFIYFPILLFSLILDNRISTIHYILHIYFAMYLDN